jgi:hypothetical protein
MLSRKHGNNQRNAHYITANTQTPANSPHAQLTLKRKAVMPVFINTSKDILALCGEATPSRGSTRSSDPSTKGCCTKGRSARA